MAFSLSATSRILAFGTWLKALRYQCTVGLLKNPVFASLPCVVSSPVFVSPVFDHQREHVQAGDMWLRAGRKWRR